MMTIKQNGRFLNTVLRGAALEVHKTSKVDHQKPVIKTRNAAKTPVALTD